MPVIGILSSARAIPGYHHLRQTVSEINEAGSPVQLRFALMLGSVAVGALVFAIAKSDGARAVRRSAVAASLIGAMHISAAGVALFAYPHPLHNLFGLSELIGYPAPLAFALLQCRVACLIRPGGA